MEILGNDANTNDLVEECVHQGGNASWFFTSLDLPTGETAKGWVVTCEFDTKTQSDTNQKFKETISAEGADEDGDNDHTQTSHKKPHKHGKKHNKKPGKYGKKRGGAPNIGKKCYGHRGHEHGHGDYSKDAKKPHKLNGKGRFKRHNKDNHHHKPNNVRRGCRHARHM